MFFFKFFNVFVLFNVFLSMFFNFFYKSEKKHVFMLFVCKVMFLTSMDRGEDVERTCVRHCIATSHQHMTTSSSLSNQQQL